MNKLRTICLAFLLVALCGACSAPAATTPTSAPAATAESSTPAGNTGSEVYGPSIAADLPPIEPDLSSFPVTVENCGRSLTFDKPPERVIGLWQPPNELLLALGLQDRIVALAGNYTTLPNDLAQASQRIKSIGTAMTWPSKEVLLNEQPDLVVSEGLEGFGFDASKGYATVAEIEANGAKVISTGGSCTPSDPSSQRKSTQTVFDDLTLLGKVFGVSSRAEALISKLQAKQATITAAVAGRPPVKVAFYNGGEGPLFVLGFGIWADLMTKAGGTNVIQPSNGFQVSVEEFATAQPEVILVGYYPGQDPQQLIEFLKRTFPTVPAVRNNRFAAIPTIETEASVRIMDGLEKIARVLHPDAL